MAQPTSWPALMRVALIASLGANLFFAGWLVGGFFRSDRPPGPRPAPLSPLPPLHILADRARGTLSPDGAQKLEALARELDARFVGNVRTMEPLRTRVKAALAAEPFDQDALIRALGEMHAANEQGRAEVDRRIAATMAQLSTDDRKRLVEITLSFPRMPGPGRAP